jgi:hypothetical protein
MEGLWQSTETTCTFRLPHGMRNHSHTPNNHQLRVYWGYFTTVGRSIVSWIDSSQTKFYVILYQKHHIEHLDSTVESMIPLWTCDLYNALFNFGYILHIIVSINQPANRIHLPIGLRHQIGPARPLDPVQSKHLHSQTPRFASSHTLIYSLHALQTE